MTAEYLFLECKGFVRRVSNLQSIFIHNNWQELLFSDFIFCCFKDAYMIFSLLESLRGKSSRNKKWEKLIRHLISKFSDCYIVAFCYFTNALTIHASDDFSGPVFAKSQLNNPWRSVSRQLVVFFNCSYIRLAILVYRQCLHFLLVLLKTTQFCMEM